MAGHYLLQITEYSGGHEFVTNHLIEAENRQKVKYHYHRTLKNWGYRDANGYGSDKHELVDDSRRLRADISMITSLSDEEYGILREFLYPWTKIQ